MNLGKYEFWGVVFLVFVVGYVIYDDISWSQLKADAIATLPPSTFTDITPSS